jgi:chromosome partitioning protein
MPGKIISLVNFKGGVGKTTLTVNLAASLAKEHDKKVLIVDLDPQSNSSIWLLRPERWSDLNAEGTFTNTSAALFYPQWTENIFIRPFMDAAGPYLPKLYLCPANLQMLKLEQIILKTFLKRRMDGVYRIGDEYFFFARGARLLRDIFDYVLIDCPPNLYFGTCNALVHSDFILIPSIPDTLSTSGLRQMIRQMETNLSPMLKTGRLKHVPKIVGIAITRFEWNTNEHKEGLTKIEQIVSEFHDGDHFLVDSTTSVFADQPLKKFKINEEAVGEGLPLCLFAPGSQAYNDVKAFTQAFLAAIEG